jgi:F-type H+-transporting ATPase subunit c
MDPVSAKLIGAGIAAIGMGGAGIGVGIIFGNFLQGALRNPSEAPKQFGNLIFGFAVTEALGIFSLLIALLLLFVDGVGGSPTNAEMRAARAAEPAAITQTVE